MAILMGGKKYKTTVNNTSCGMHVKPSSIITNGIRLLSSDNYVLTAINRTCITLTDYDIYHVELLSIDNYILSDVDGISIMAYDFEECDMQMSTLDDCMLQDLNNLYLTTRKR